MRILLGITGGVAAFKAASIIRLLTEQGHQVRVIATENALRFIGETTLANLSKNKVNVDLYADTDEGAHIELADWAERVLIAPATASVIGRLANGIATDLLTNVVLATSAPVTIAPAMHSNMYLNPATQENLEKLKARGVEIIEPSVGRLSGNDSGIGRLPEPEDIVHSFMGVLPLAGIRAVVTMGGTRESIDSVRYIGNHSSGKQGMAFARALRDLGAEVKLIKAHTTVDTRGYETVSVSSHADLQKAMAESNCDLLIMAAAVSDFKVATNDKKLDRDSPQSISLQPTEDLVAEFKKNNPETIVLGFSVADSSADWLEKARAKRSSKGLEFLFANTTEAFDSDITHAFLIAEEELEFSGNKDVVAREVMQVIQKAILK